MTHPKQISDTDLSAYVDGELGAIEVAKVEAWLLENPQGQATVDSYRSQNTTLHDMFDTVLKDPLPMDLVDLVADKPTQKGLPTWAQFAAAVALVLLGAAGGWGVRGGGAPASDLPRFVERAVGAHLVYASEVLHPVEVRVDQLDHLEAWLSKRLGSPLRAPVLDGVGFSLIGGRLLEGENKPAAQFMYEDARGRRVTVYQRNDDGKDTSFKFYGGDHASAFYWKDGPFSYALASEISRSELMEVAHVVYQELIP